MAKKKGLRVRTGARTASKVQERELISNARKLRKNPDLLLPTCDGSCKGCPFEKMKRNLERISKFKDDEKKLAKLSRAGDQLGRAYAATLQIALAGKAPYLAVARFPFGDVAYAVRGKVKKEKLIGVQHFTDPRWRLLSVLDIAMRKKIFIFSTKTGMICTGTTPKPPKEYLQVSVSSLKYYLTKSGNVYHCEHLTPKVVREEGLAEEAYLRMKWDLANITFGVCRKCSSDKENIFSTLTRNMAGPDPKKEFALDIIYKIKCTKDKCTTPERPQVDKKDHKD